MLHTEVGCEVPWRNEEADPCKAFMGAESHGCVFGDREAQRSCPSGHVGTSGIPAQVLLWGDAAAHVKSVGCVWTPFWHLDPCAFPSRCRHYSEILETPHTGVFASVLVLWLWHCSISSHPCSIDSTKKLMPLRLGLILFKPWVFASRLVSCFREEEDYNQVYFLIWSNSLGSVGEKAVPPLPSTSGTPISIAVAKESCEHVISSCWCIHPSSGLSSAIP